MRFIFFIPALLLFCTPVFSIQRDPTPPLPPPSATKACIESEAALLPSGSPLSPAPVVRAQLANVDVEKALSAPDDWARVDELRHLLWQNLTEVNKTRMLERAAKLTHSYEIGAYIQIAAHSDDARWAPVLERWLEHWRGTKDGWQTYKRVEAEAALRRIRKLPPGEVPTAIRKLDGVIAHDKDGRGYRIQVMGHERLPLLIVRPVDGSREQGTMSLNLIGQSGQTIEVDEAEMNSLKGKGVGTEVFKEIFKVIPSGTEVQLYSVNGPTNSKIVQIAKKFAADAGYTPGKPLNSRDDENTLMWLISRELAKRAEKDVDSLPLWPKVLYRAGFRDLEVRRGSDLVGGFYIHAKKP